jgi:hypothetical protein
MAKRFGIVDGYAAAVASSTITPEATKMNFRGTVMVLSPIAFENVFGTAIGKALVGSPRVSPRGQPSRFAGLKQVCRS